MDRNILAVNTHKQTASKLFNPLTECSIKKQEHHIRNDVENRCVFTALPHVADLTTYMIQDVISFSKSLQDFQ